MKTTSWLTLFFMIGLWPVNAQTENKQQPLYILDLDKAPKIEYISATDLFSNVNCCILEAKEECLIGHISKMEVYKEQIIILDKVIAKGIFIFDINGSFIRQIGCIGQGPGEYRYIDDFTIDYANEHLWVLSGGDSKINIYNLHTGNFISDISIKNDRTVTSHHLYLENKTNTLYLDAYFKEHSKNNYLLREVDIKSGVEKKNFFNVYTHNNNWSNTYLIDDPTFLSTGTNDKTFYVQQYMDTVFAIQKEQIYPFMVIKSKDFISKSETKELPYTINPVRIHTIPSQIHNIKDIFETDDYIFLRYIDNMGLPSAIYEKNTEKLSIIARIKDNLLFSKDILDLFPTFGYKDNQFVYFYFGTYANERFQHYAKQGVLKNLPFVNELKTLSEDDNPLIFYYELKK